MSEFQSNAAFHLSKNSLKHRSSHIVLPPYLIHGMAARTFWCIIYGSSVPFEISVHSNVNITRLKEEIKQKKNAFGVYDASKLVLWKLNVPEPVDPEDTLWPRIRQRGDSVETFAEQLTISGRKMSSVFPQSQLPLEGHVYFLVQLPSKDTRSWLAVMHHKLWRDHQSFGKIFRTVTLTKDHFGELQSLLDIENPGRTSDSYVAKDVLAKKSEFLRENSDPLETDFGNGLAPRLVFDTSQPPSSVNVNDDVADDAMDINPDHGFADPHMNHLSNEATAIFPYTIRYVDLTLLKLQNDLRVPPLMLFRNEWGTMIDIFNESEGSTVFTGQPGIGKTCMLYSILILCMIRGKPFVFQDMYGKVFIIDHNGIEEGISDNSLVLALVDADIKCFEPDGDLWINSSKHRILVTSSPRSKKDRRWLKQSGDENAVETMKPWSREEFVVATLFLQKTDITLKRLQKASFICGNIPRPCFKAAKSPAALHKAERVIKNAIEQIDDLFKIALNMQNGDNVQIIHRAFQVRPASSEDRFWDSCVAEPVSPWAFSKILDVLHKCSKDKAYRFYCMIKGHPEASVLCGKIFENNLHPYLKHPRTFFIRSLDNPDTTLAIDFIVDTDNHLGFTDLSQELLSVKSNTAHYLWPKSPIFPSFDSFLFQPKFSDPRYLPLIALQVTTAAKHEIKLKGLQGVQRSLDNPLLKNLLPEKNKKMIILFVVPDELEKTFGSQKITGAKAEVAPWYNKTAQFVLGLPEEDLFIVEAPIASKT